MTIHHIVIQRHWRLADNALSNAPDFFFPEAHFFLDFVFGSTTVGIVKATSTKVGAAVSAAVITKSNLDATIPLRVNSELKQALLLLACQDDRSLSNYIVRLLEAHVASATTATFTMKGASKGASKAAKK